MDCLRACALPLACLLTACAGPASLPVIGERTQRQQAQIEQLLAAPAQDTKPVRYSEGSWIPLRRLERTAREADWQRTDAVQIEIHQQFANLNEIAGAVSALTGWPVLVAADVPAAPAGAGAGAASVPTLPLPPGVPSGLPPRPLPGGVLPGAGLANGLPALPAGPITPGSAFAANYAGTLTGFMNLVAAYYGLSWKWGEGALRFYLLESRTFRIAALPGDARLSSSVDAGASTAGAGGGASGAVAGGAGAAATLSGNSSNSTGVGFSGLSVWSAIELAVKQMLGVSGKVVASPATGTLTVTDTPLVLDRVAEYLQEQNRSLNRQVSIHVRVLSVELEEGEHYGIQWDLVYARLAGARPYAIGLTTAATSAEGVGNLVLAAPASSASRWAGSQAVVSALSSQGRVTELTSASVVTLNNQPVPVNVGRRVSYLAASSTSQTANVGSTTSLTPGTVSTGFSMTLVPHILDGKELLLQYAVDLSSLLRLKTIRSGLNTIEAPDVSTSSFIQRVRLQSGETLVVAGFDQDNLSAVAQGVGHPENTLLGQRTGNSKRTMLVILIQPTLAHADTR